jgi:hypothetical protein
MIECARSDIMSEPLDVGQYPLYIYQNWFLDASKLLVAVEKLWITGALDRHPKMATPRETASVLALAVVAVGPATSRYTMPRIAV